MKTTLPAILVALLLTLTGCASTRISGTWRDPGYSARINRVLVLGVAKQESTRKIFESAFANGLDAEGVTAVPSFSVLPDGGASQEEINAAAKKIGVDTILVTKLVDLKKEKQRVTDINTDRSFNGRNYPYDYYDGRYPPPSHWYNDYSRSYTTVRSYDVTYKVLDLETNLYDFNSGKLIWTILTRTTTSEAIQSQTQEIVKVLIRQLRQDGLL
ncbi:hypothetical protein JCM30471_26960 [Desulfuromonas carbonis]|uniref:hypothetical protein n=1 Tax=Desulfuromonas sp. DDH964 TaxID=1823759 RepID=UPI00078BAB26|nr:hypothetical protein [Desulfuromonas sp. DDH964]AMV70889.1 hypothetical protein DBW_0488 [Desulfuromonas sp. DDH964]